jgi:UDP:flavonoid glycosyltransferase YjiC (YdhE family)
VGATRPPHRPGWPTLPATLERPLVLATCSTLYQNDLCLARAVCEGLDGEPLDVVLTTGELDVTSLPVPANVRVEPYALAERVRSPQQQTPSDR